MTTGPGNGLWYVPLPGPPGPEGPPGPRGADGTLGTPAERLHFAQDLAAAEAAADAAAVSETNALSYQTGAQTAQQLSQAWADGHLPGGAGTKSSKEWQADAASLFAGGYTASTIPVGNAAAIKALNTATYPFAIRNEAGKVGLYKWNAAITAGQAYADPLEYDYLAPTPGSAGAYARVQLSDNEKAAINRALNERPFEDWIDTRSVFSRNEKQTRYIDAGKPYNLCSSSEDLNHAHYVKDGWALGPRVTLSVASPAVVTYQNHGLAADQEFRFAITDLSGALPTGVAVATSYYVLATGLTADSFQFSATVGGAAINTSGTNTAGVIVVLLRATPTLTIASPCVVTLASHGLKDHDIIQFISTTGAFPTGIAANSYFYVKRLDANTFEMSASPGGASIVTAGLQSGVHTVQLTRNQTVIHDGVVLSRINCANYFFSGVKDSRSADITLTAGKRYILSAHVAAPFDADTASSAGLTSGPRRLVRQWLPSNNTAYGHGAKLIGARPRRIWTQFIAPNPASNTFGYMLSDPRYPFGRDVPIVSISGDGVNATVTHSANFNLFNGQLLRIVGNTPGTFDSTAATIANVDNGAKTFTYANTTVGAASVVGNINDRLKATYFVVNSDGGFASVDLTDLFAGGLQLEEAPNQTERPAIGVIGTSIDTGTSTLDHRTTDFGWPRWFEGALSVPVFNLAIGGQNSSQLLARFDTDVGPCAPNIKYMILAANVNDMDGQGVWDFDLYKSNWLSMYNKSLDYGMIPIFVTPERTSTYGTNTSYSNKQDAITWVKATFPMVIDRDEVMQDCFNANLLNERYDGDHTHPNYAGLRAFAMMVAHKYRHWFHFDNVPRPYQRTAYGTTGAFGNADGFLWAEGLQSATLDAGTAALTQQETLAGRAPLVIFTGTAGSAKTFQFSHSNYRDEAQPANTTRAFKVWNATSDGYILSIQMYKKVAGVVTSYGSPVLVTPGSLVEIITDGASIIASPVKSLSATVSYNPPDLAAGAADTIQTITVNGAALGDRAKATFSLDLQGVLLFAYVSAANTVSYQFVNPLWAAGNVNLASGTVKALVFKD